MALDLMAKTTDSSRQKYTILPPDNYNSAFYEKFKLGNITPAIKYIIFFVQPVINTNINSMDINKFVELKNKEFNDKKYLIEKELSKLSTQDEKISLLFDYFFKKMISRSQIKILGNLDEWELSEWYQKLDSSYK